MIINTTMRPKGSRSLRHFLFAFTTLTLQCKFSGISYALASSHQHLPTTSSSSLPHSRNVELGESTESVVGTGKKKFKLIQVQIVHRHGDRTPITPLKDEEYWSTTLPSEQLLSKIASGTTIIRDNGEMKVVPHAAGGRGPFGKLTQLGLLQMVEVGSRLREQLHLSEHDDDSYHVDDEGHIYVDKGCLFTHKSPLHPAKIKVKSTDFPRTIQSVQAVLIGLFPDGLPEGTQIEIDARHTNVMIPDPQPRTSREQIELEIILSQRKHLLDRETELRDLAFKISKELKPILSDDASSVSYGIGEEGGATIEERPLSWAQLSEIMTCLKVRGMLPDTISHNEYEITQRHAAWKWFENLRHMKLAYLAMKPFMNFIMNNLRHGQRQSLESTTEEEEEDCSALHIYSAHDSSLIGLMCAFRLQQPSEWPEYGSYLKIELFEADSIDENKGKEYYVRFSLNNNVLKSTWGLGHGDYLEAKDMIPLHHLETSILNEHGH